MSGMRCLVFVFSLSSIVQGTSSPAPSGSRTVVYHAHDVVSLRAKVRFTTMIVLPEGEEIVEATSGDKEFWIVNARGSVASIKPAKAGSETNVNLTATSGQVYSFRLIEVSNVKNAEPDLAVYLEPDDPTSATLARHSSKYVPAELVEELRTQLAVAREDARRATLEGETKVDASLTAFRRAYPLALRFPYRFTADLAPFYIHAMFHDDHVTYLQMQGRGHELPVLYELKDGAPNLVAFEVRGQTYVVPKILDRGYLSIGRARWVFTRDARDDDR